MALTVTAQITGQIISSTTSYCYLYESLKVDVLESDSLGKEVYVDLIVKDSTDGSTVVSELKYGTFDINPNNSLEIDLMRIIQQYHDANVFKIGVASEIATSKEIVISKYKYDFKVYSDVSPAGVTVSKLPIVGGRDFHDFTPSVDENSPIHEGELYNIDLTSRWKDFPNISTSLNSPTALNSMPTISVTTETQGCIPYGGMIIWKSRFGGWMYWGMDISNTTKERTYDGGLTVGMFEATSNGNPFIPVDYTQIQTSYSVSLKALSLTNDELKAVSGVAHSPAVYYMRDSSSKLELMRVTSSSHPISTLANGGDFSIILKSISKTSQKAR